MIESMNDSFVKRSQDLNWAALASPGTRGQNEGLQYSKSEVERCKKNRAGDAHWSRGRRQLFEGASRVETPK
jgi:hypothetical protein